MDFRLAAAQIIFSGDESDVELSLEFLDEQTDNTLIVSDHESVWDLFEYKDVRFIRHQLKEFETALEDAYQKGFSDGLAKSPSVEEEFGDD